MANVVSINHHNNVVVALKNKLIEKDAHIRCLENQIKMLNKEVLAFDSKRADSNGDRLSGVDTKDYGAFDGTGPFQRPKGFECR